MLRKRPLEVAGMAELTHIDGAPCGAPTPEGVQHE